MCANAPIVAATHWSEGQDQIGRDRASGLAPGQRRRDIAPKSLNKGDKLSPGAKGQVCTRTKKKGYCTKKSKQRDSLHQDKGAGILNQKVKTKRQASTRTKEQKYCTNRSKLRDKSSPGQRSWDIAPKNPNKGKNLHQEKAAWNIAPKSSNKDVVDKGAGILNQKVQTKRQGEGKITWL